MESHVDFWAEMEFENAMMIGRSALTILQMVQLMRSMLCIITL